MKPAVTMIIKASGKRVPFEEEKLRTSLRRSGAAFNVIDSITEEVKNYLYEGMPTKEIYQVAFGLLKKHPKPFAAKYKLKPAIMELGPSGYPFEKYIAEMLQHKGFIVKVGEVVKGSCVNHEIDVLAEKDNKHYLIECKYHNTPGIICNVKIPLYIEARFRDVKNEWQKNPGNGSNFHEGWVVTNTKFSSDAIQYGTCMGLKLIGWDYPATGSLNQLVESSGLYPLTCLTTLTAKEKQILLDNNVVLCREICDKPSVLNLAHISEPRIKNILLEAFALCKDARK